MASYHTSFSYNGTNSFKNMGLIITSFEPDDEFKDTFLSMDVISDDYYDGTKKYTYGSKYNQQANISITVIKHDGSDFSVNEVRSCLRWLTGARVDSWLDMYVSDDIVYSFLGRVTDVKQRKMDARTIGLEIIFSSISPWAYSTPQSFECVIKEPLVIVEDGVLTTDNPDIITLCSDNGSLYVKYIDESSYFKMVNEHVAYIDNAYAETIDNKSDDLYTYIYLDIDYENENCTHLAIANKTLKETSTINDISKNEHISLSSKQFIISSIDGKIFGDDFNFVWPRLQPGINQLLIQGDSRGTAKFTYRYPIKIGDCAMDVSVYGDKIGCGCDGYMPSYDTVKWEDIVGAPTTLGGYGITDAYTADEVDNKIENVDVEWSDVNNTPTTIEGYGIKDAYTTSDVYTKTEVDDKIDDVEISGGGGGSTNIDEDELNKMLDDILG